MPRYLVGVVALVIGLPSMGHAQLVQRNAQYRLPASYNNTFRSRHPAAARSFYAAHVAHFAVYEVGLGDSASVVEGMPALETRVRRLVAEPPRFEPPFDLVAPGWSTIAYATGAAMDWTHHLHTDLYDILADDRVTDKRVAGERAISYYLSHAASAFSTRGYGHAFMRAGGTWAGTFAQRFPGMNGILWAYHWHHAAVYEALMESDPAARHRELERVIRVFQDSVLVDPPTYMPLTAEIAPRFGAMFPAAAHIFDNLHMMHDVVNDIMVDPAVPLPRKGIEIERLRLAMSYMNQTWVVPPTVPMGAHGDMPMRAMTVPTRLPSGRWLPQGHPDARRAMGGMSHDAPAGRHP